MLVIDDNLEYLNPCLSIHYAQQPEKNHVSYLTNEAERHMDPPITIIIECNNNPMIVFETLVNDLESDYVSISPKPLQGIEEPRKGNHPLQHLPDQTLVFHQPFAT